MQPEVHSDNGEGDHGTKVQGQLFESCTDSPAFLQVTKAAFDDIAMAIRFFVEVRIAPTKAVFIFAGGNNHLHMPAFKPAAERRLGIPFVTGQPGGPAVTGGLLAGMNQKVLSHLQLAGLAGCQQESHR